METEERKVDRKERMKIPHTPVPERDPWERIKDFEVISFGYDAESAMREAGRCIQCPEPKCMQACPLGNNIREAMWLISEGNFMQAADLYRQTSIFPEICGRVCPQEKLCEGACPLGKRGDPPALGALEMFVADYQRAQMGWPLPEVAPPSGKRAAIVGAGPAGLAAAEVLAKRGHRVTVFDAMPSPGGLLVYGIPNFKLPKSLVADKAAMLERLGVEFVCNTRIGEHKTVDDLFAEGFDAVFLGVGANVDAKLKAPGVNLEGIYYSGEFLQRTSPSWDQRQTHWQDLPYTGRRVAVIGGGDTASDCLRTARRLGADEVICYYRRTEAEMPGSKKERQHAIEEGARIEYLVAPVAFIDNGEGRLQAMTLQRMELGEPDASGRRRPVPVEGSEFTVPIDTVVLALGYWPEEVIGKTTPDLETHDWGLISADTASGRTSREGVFAAGDAVTGPDLVSTAAAAGLRAGEAMHEYLMRRR
ncbi:MAG: NAD(P)-dependent oxidoreductase [Anaerolineales bacterium]|nr:NAD(P)-dependent oxidoreductase [Anaerolineales bacterium]